MACTAWFTDHALAGEARISDGSRRSVVSKVVPTRKLKSRVPENQDLLSRRSRQCLDAVTIRLFVTRPQRCKHSSSRGRPDTACSDPVGPACPGPTIGSTLTGLAGTLPRLASPRTRAGREGLFHSSRGGWVNGSLSKPLFCIAVAIWAAKPLPAEGDNSCAMRWAAALSCVARSLPRLRRK